MKELFVNQDSARVGYFKSVLDEASILNIIQNENSHNEPNPLFFPTLCVMNDEDYPRAMELLGAMYYAQPSTGREWKCPSCGELVPDNFETCWKCQASRTPL
jgi:hypothetical protein